MSDDQDTRAAKSRLKAATDELVWAVRIIESHKGSLVYRKSVNVGKGNNKIVTLHLPGILRISDAQTGRVTAESRPGDLLTLAEGFEPVPPTY